MKNSWYAIAVLLSLVIVLFLDHYYNHKEFYDYKDFANALFMLFKSHEGLIILLLLLSAGIFIGGMLK